jgi:hypothetical protein
MLLLLLLLPAPAGTNAGLPPTSSSASSTLTLSSSTPRSIESATESATDAPQLDLPGLPVLMGLFPPLLQENPASAQLPCIFSTKRIREVSNHRRFRNVPPMLRAPCRPSPASLLLTLVRDKPAAPAAAELLPCMNPSP